MAIALLMVTWCCPQGALAADLSTSQVEQVLLGSDFGSCDSLQQLLDQELVNMAGKGAEFVVLAIRQYGSGYNFDVYLSALDKYLENTNNLPATTMQKIGLVQYACGGITEVELLDIAHGTEGQQGIMSIVFALHIYSNLDQKQDAQRCITALIDQQGTMGGWGLSIEASTVDITAMTIQALAPYYQDVQGVREAVDKAVEYIWDSQQPSGGFLSYGIENCESVAQVIIALASLGRDYKTEITEKKDSLMDVMLAYQLESGGFAHVAGGQVNMTATAQAVMAMVALDMENRGAGSIYTFGQYDFGSGDTILQEPVDHWDTKVVQQIIAISLGISITAYIAVGICRKKLSPMDVITMSLVGVAVCAFILFSKIETPKEYYSYNLPVITEDSQIVTLSIMDGDRAIVSLDEYVLLEGDTVFDMVHRVTRAKGIPIGYVSGWDIYISSLGDLSEGDRGATSGWVYYVNGVQPQVGVGSYRLQPGDVVELRYVDSYGGGDNE